MNNLISTQPVRSHRRQLWLALLVVALTVPRCGVAAAERAGADASAPSPQDRQAKPATLALSALLSTPHSAELAELERRPHVLVASERPLEGHIRFESETAVELADKDLSLWNIVVTSIAEGQVVDRATLARSAATDEQATDQSATASSDDEAGLKRAHVAFRGTRALQPGVYELKLEPSVSAGARWRELLPWERGGDKDSGVPSLATAAPHDWTLIILPKVSSPSNAPSSRATFVHWAGFPELDALGEGAGTTAPVSSRFSWILSGADREGASLSQRWADVLSRINQRLDAIAAASATGIVVDAASPTNLEDGRDLHALLLRYMHAQGAKRGLGLWQVEATKQPEAVADGVSGDGLAAEQVLPPAHSTLTLRRWDANNGAADSDQRLGVAVFLRPPANTIRGQFPAQMHAADDSDLIWLGARRRAPGYRLVASDAPQAVDSGPSDAPADDFPLAHLDPAFAANAWLTDWAKWCTVYTPANTASPDYHQGLVVDESLLNGEALPESASVRDATQLWRACWTADSRWLSRTAATDAGFSSGSLVHLRHANLDEGSTIIWINQAPWPMKVTLSIDEQPQWHTQAPPALEMVRLTQPTVTKAGHVVVIPACSILVSHARHPIAATLQFTTEMDDARNRVALLTQQVTTIVENLGLLGELSGMTSTAITPAQRLVNSQSSRSRLASQRTASQRGLDSSQPAANSSTSWGSSLWSSDRWSLSRAVTATDSSGASKQTGATAVGAAAGRLRSAATQVPMAHPSATNSQCRNLLRNGGFEEQQQLGIPGWMHAHHPIDAVVIDSLVHSEGRQAVRMAGQTTAGAASWLISREIARPAAGRIGISISILGEAPQPHEKTAASLAESTPPAAIRVAIESERDGQPIRHSKMVKVNNNGKWQIAQPVLEWLDVDPDQDQNLRVTIDNFSATPVWVDDIVVTDYFASSAERTELQSLAYLAVQGLQHSDFRPAAYLLNNFWAKDLLRVAQRPPGSELESAETTTEDVSVLPRGRSPFDGGGLPTPVWRSGAAPVESEPLKTSQTMPKSLAPAVVHPIRSGTVHTQPSDTSNATAATAEPPASVAGRIRNWLPTPLRF